jgi:exopolyphosphatase / guanosine-5'-triphosphate,3'-diphosphate pyrophosphatase
MLRRMRVGALDVGSNTIRLLVASVERGEVAPLGKDKVRLPLGEEIERFGAVSDLHVAAAAKAVRKLTKTARELGVESLDVFLTAPGRQSENASELVAALVRAAGVPVRVLSTEEEGCLAYAGAVATAPLSLPGRIAVCDVGGASTEVAVGSPGVGPDWVASVALGSVRLTARVLDVERMTRRGLEAARLEAEDAFGDVRPPAVETALAVGGSARAARRLVGARLGPDELREALRLVAAKHPRAIARRYGVDRARARILPAGIVLLGEVQRRLGVPLHVCDGGIREGAVLASVEALAA